MKMRKTIFALLALCLLLAGCAEKETAYERTYRLAQLLCEGEPLELSEYYAEGGSLALSSTGSAILQLGGKSCETTWAGSGESISLSVGSLTASGTLRDDAAELTIGELGLTYVFTLSGEPLPEETPAPTPAAEENELQQQWNGTWSGRLWYSDTSGEWTDYETRTLAMTAEISLDAGGAGTLTLRNDFYSEEYAMGQFPVHFSDGQLQVEEGLFMSYSVASGEMTAVRTVELPEEIENTIIMHPDVWEYGHFYQSTEEGEEAPESEPVDVLRLTGSVKDADGGFSYKIVLTRE